MRFVSGNLQHAVGGGVEDRLAGPDALLAEFGDDIGPRSMAVAQNAGNAAVVDDLLDQRRGEGGNCPGKITPIEGHRHAGDLPVPRWRVLASGDFGGRAPEPLRRSPVANARSTGKTEAVEMGQLEGPAPQAVAVGRTQVCSLADMAQRVCPRITELSGVVGSADPDGVEDNENRATQKHPPVENCSALTIRAAGAYRHGLGRIMCSMCPKGESASLSDRAAGTDTETRRPGLRRKGQAGVSRAKGGRTEEEGRFEWGKSSWRGIARFNARSPAARLKADRFASPLPGVTSPPGSRSADAWNIARRPWKSLSPRRRSLPSVRISGRKRR